MGRMPVPLRPRSFDEGRCLPSSPWGITRRFHRLSPGKGLVAYALRTRAPLSLPRRGDPVRLACIRPAASVHPEPGSNSSLYYCCTCIFFLNLGFRCCFSSLPCLLLMLASDCQRTPLPIPSSKPLFHRGENGCKITAFSDTCNIFPKFFSKNFRIFYFELIIRRIAGEQKNRDGACTVSTLK